MKNQTKAYYCGILAVLCWSTVATAFKISLNYLTPAQLLFIASLTSWIFFAFLIVVQKKVNLLFSYSKKEYYHSFLFGVINPFIYYLLLFKAYDLLQAQEAQTINFSWAITLSLLSVPILKQSLRAQDLTAALVCYSGVWVISTQGNVFSMAFSNLNGVALALLTTILWALYWIFNTKDTRDPLVGLFLNFSVAIPLLSIYCLITGEFEEALTTTSKALSWPALGGAVYVGFFEMGLSFILWLKAMKYTTSTAKIANLIFLAPFISLILIHHFVGEDIKKSTITGLILIITGLLIQQKK